MTYVRKCENWLSTFQKWIAPRSEAPEAYIFWAGAFTLASALRRRVFLGEKVFGSWTCYPHMYVMFVGPPGMRKTTALERSVDLLSQVDEIKRPPTLITKESLVQSVISSPDASLSVTVGEFSDLILKGGKDMYDLITSLYDSKRDLSVGTMMRGYEGATRPCVNFLSCTTPSWISANVPEESIGGGFASRFVFVYESELPNRQLYRRKHMGDDKIKYYNELEVALVDDLKHIANAIEGEFDITDEAEDFGEKWYKNLSVKNVHKKIQGYVQRKHLHVHKLAMVLTVARSDELIITKETLEAAINIVTMTEQKLPNVFSGVGKNIYSVTMEDIYEYIAMNSPVKRSDVLRQFKSNAEPAKLDTFIASMVSMKYATVDVSEDGDWIYTIIPVEGV